MNGVAQIPHAINNFYSRTLLERAVPLLVHQMFAQIRDIPQGNTDVIKFRRYGALAVNTTALTPGVTPAGKQASVTSPTAQVYQYGDYMEFDDFVLITSPDPILTETADMLGEQAGRSLDQIIRDVIVAGTNVQYATGVVGRGNITAAMKLTGTEIRLAVRTLKRADATRITRRVAADTGFATQPVDECFVAIVHPDTTYDIQTDALFVGVEKYGGRASVMPGEVGKISEVRFIETTHAKVFTGQGDSGANVYATMVIAKNAYGVSRISGKAMQNIVKALGSAGTADPLNQRQTSGWKATLAAIRLNEDYMVRIEHGVTA